MGILCSNVNFCLEGVLSSIQLPSAEAPHKRGREDGRGDSKTKSKEDARLKARRGRLLFCGCILAKTTTAGIDAAMYWVEWTPKWR